MGFLAGAAAGYKGYSEESRRIADEDRRVKQDTRMDQDAAFQEEMRGRQRTDWKEIDAEKVAVANDRAALQKEKSSSNDDVLGKISEAPKAVEAPVEKKSIAQTFAPVAKQIIVDPNAEQSQAIPVVGGLPVPKTPIQLNQKIDLANSAPVESQNVAPSAALVPQAGGMIQKPRNFNSILDDELALLQKKVSRGKASAQDYAQSMRMVNQMKSEGVHEALNLMSSGDYEGAMDKFNSVGMRRGAKIVSGREGMTLVDGDQVPTHFVTIQNADGTRTEVDVTKARYQLMDFDKQLANKDRSATRQMQADYHKGQLSIAQQNANTQEQYRRDQAENMRQQREMQLKALNAAQAQVVKGNNFAEGFDLEKSYDTVLKGIMEANKEGAALGNKDYVPKTAEQMAIEATQATNKAFQQHVSNNQARFLRNSAIDAMPKVKSGAIKFESWAELARAANLPDAEIEKLNPNPAKPIASQSPKTNKVIPDVGGIKQASNDVATSRGIDLRNDPVISTLNSQLKTMNMNDPANTAKIMALGKAKNERLSQLQEKYGRLTPLITE